MDSPCTGPAPGPSGPLADENGVNVVEVAKKDVGPDDVFTEDVNTWAGVSTFMETARGSVMRAVLCIALGWARRW